MTNVLVTGGAGYIGSHCCKELHSRGFNPITGCCLNRYFASANFGEYFLFFE